MAKDEPAGRLDREAEEQMPSWEGQNPRAREHLPSEQGRREVGRTPSQEKGRLERRVDDTWVSKVDSD